MSLVQGKSDASHLTATTVRTDETETAKIFPSAAARIAELQRRSARVLHGVDATALSSANLEDEKYDRILFTFPLVVGYPTSCPENKNLVGSFLFAAKKVLKPRGAIELTLAVGKKGGAQYDRWAVEEAATSARLALAHIHNFKFSTYPGYCPRNNDGSMCLKVCARARTYVFMHAAARLRSMFA